MGGVPGYYVEEAWCGPITWIIGCLVFPFVCCCPCDRRQVFVPLPQQTMMAPGAQTMQPTAMGQPAAMPPPTYQPMQAPTQQYAQPSYYPPVK